MPREASDAVSSRCNNETPVFLGAGLSSEVTPANIMPVAGSSSKPMVEVPSPAPRLPAPDLEKLERVAGNAYFKDGDYLNAAKSYTRCLGINPWSGAAVSNRAMCYLKMREWIKAEQDAARALEIDPGHIKSYQRRSAARWVPVPDEVC